MSDEEALRAARDSVERANRKFADMDSKPVRKPLRAECLDTDGRGDFICACPTCGSKFNAAYENADAARECRVCHASLLLPSKDVFSAAYAARVVNPRVSDEVVEELQARVQKEDEAKSHVVGCALLSVVVVVLVAAIGSGSFDDAVQGSALVGMVLGALVGVSAPNTDGTEKFFAMLLCGSTFGIGAAIIGAAIGSLVH